MTATYHDPRRAVWMHGATARRMPSSRNGNPAYQLVGEVEDPELDGFRWLGLFTSPDTMAAYNVGNVFGGALDRPRNVRLLLNARDMVVGIELAGEQP